jgi:hypothetical protein
LGPSAAALKQGDHATASAPAAPVARKSRRETTLLLLNRAIPNDIGEGWDGHSGFRSNSLRARLPPKETRVPRRLRQALPAQRHLRPISDGVEAWRESLHYCPAQLAGSALLVCEQRIATPTTRREAQPRTRRLRSRWRNLHSGQATKSVPQGLFRGIYGTTKVVPCYKACHLGGYSQSVTPPPVVEALLSGRVG